MRIVKNKLIIIVACTITLIALAGNAYALPAAAPTTPPTFNTGGGSGSGGGGGGSYTPPAFKPYSINLTSSGSNATGSIDVKDYYLSTVTSNRTLGSGNDTWYVGFMADMGGVPASARMEILPVTTGNFSLPLDTGLFSPLASFNLTRYSSGGEWPMKDGTVSLMLKMPLDMLNGMDLSKEFYLLKDDGTRFIIYRVMPVIKNGTAIFNVPLWYESQSPSTSGIFTLAGPIAGASTASTPTPTPVPATPTPKSGSNASLLLLAAALGIAAIFVTRGRKQ
jgi:hypothetical protein